MSEIFSKITENEARISRLEKMLDIKFIRENPELVRKNMENKFQHAKVHLVDEVLELDEPGSDGDGSGGADLASERYHRRGKLV